MGWPRSRGLSAHTAPLPASSMVSTHPACASLRLTPEGAQTTDAGTQGREEPPRPVLLKQGGPTVSFKRMATSVLEASISAPSILSSCSETQRWGGTSRSRLLPASELLSVGREKSGEMGRGEKKGGKD